MEGIPRRPHVQGDARGLGLETTEESLTDGAGLLLFRAMWDRLELGARLDAELSWMGGRYRPSMLIEQWVALLLHGGTCMDHLPRLESRGIRALFGWKTVADPTCFGRFLRRGGVRAAKAVSGLQRRLVRARWDSVGRVPRAVMLMLDATVSVRYGEKQAGAEMGYNPTKPGRPSHHPQLAYLDTGDCLGVQWRPGNANCAAGAEEWIEEQVRWLRAQGVKRILVRLDKGYFRVALLKKLLALEVDFVVKMQESKSLQAFKGEWTRYRKGMPLLVSASKRWEVRMLGMRWVANGGDDELPLGEVVVEKQETILTNLEGLDAVTAWRMYNQGALVEQDIKATKQLGVGRTAVNDIGGNHLLWHLGVLTYQLQHMLRTRVLDRGWEGCQVETLRSRLYHTPAKLVCHARRLRLKLMSADPVTVLLLRVLRRLPRMNIMPLPT
jgi:Transposase DDE domain group 1